MASCVGRNNTSREICKICYHVNRVGFLVSDEIWMLVIPEKFQSCVVCLSCFTELADEKLVAWDRDIKFYPVSFASHFNYRKASIMN